MPFELHDLYKIFIWAHAGNPKPSSLKGLYIIIVKFVAMAMPLVHNRLAIGSITQSIWHEPARVRAEAHSASHIRDVALLLHQMYNGVWRIRIELGAVSRPQPAHISGELDDCHLHPQAQTQKGYTTFSGVSSRRNFPLNAAVAEAPRNYYPMYIAQERFRTAIVHLLRFDAMEVHGRAVRHTSMS